MNYVVINGELYHHGILGQKWGVRRYQNKDGSLTAAGKRRLSKDWKKGLENKETRKETEKKISDHIDNVMNDSDKQKLHNLKETWLKLSDEYERNDISENEISKIQDRAYNDVYKWFEKNNPAYLSDIVAKNGGSKKNLDMFHDFRKELEGTEDEYITKAVNEHKKQHPEFTKLEEQEKRAWTEYSNECERVGKQIVGSYSDMKVKGSYSYQNLTVGDFVTEQIMRKRY